MDEAVRAGIGLLLAEAFALILELVRLPGERSASLSVAMVCLGTCRGLRTRCSLTVFRAPVALIAFVACTPAPRRCSGSGAQEV
jgi:hypothetical protein